MSEGATRAVEAAGKVGVYAALLLALGACAAHWWLLPRVRGLDAGGTDRLSGALRRLLRRAAVCLFAAVTARLWLHTAAAFGWGAMFEWSQLRIIAIDSRWGRSWRWQLLASAAAAGSAWAMRRGRRAGWVVTSIAVAGAMVALPLLGHAAGAPWRVALHTAHVLGGGLWLGTLGVLVLVPVSAADRQALLRAFSPLALSGAAVVAPSGLAAAWLYLGSLPALWTTSYGRLLAMKIALVTAAAACGFVNWQRYRRERARARSEAIATSGADGFVPLEVALAVVIVLLTSLLTETAHP